MRAALALAALSSAAAFDCTFLSSYPRQYVAYSTSTPLTLDGKLDDPAWAEVAWTEDFVDISTNSTPSFNTRAKLRYDANYLYVGGYIEDTAAWANITSTCHCLNNTQDQVIYHDNDFEVFVDPAGTTHMYKETEVNAAGASWDLCLNKPYNDGGYENSTRVFGTAGWDMYWMNPGLRSAAWTDGALNDATVPHTHWTVEIALPLAGLVYNTSASYPPQNGDQWRINFSRVEWATIIRDGKYIKAPSCQSCPTPGANCEDNWVWSPQGSIAMHLPEKWGFLQFSSAPVNTTPPVRNPEWPVRSVVAALYYAQHAYAGANNGSYATTAAALAPYVADPSIVNGTCTTGVPTITTFSDPSTGAQRFNATAVSMDGAFVAGITDDRFLTVAPAPGAASSEEGL